MIVDSALFEQLEPSAEPGFIIRIYATGSGFEHRAHPVLARVGQVPVEQLIVASDGGGFTGLLTEAPNDGDRLFVRYADEAEFPTNVVFGTAPNA